MKQFKIHTLNEFIHINYVALQKYNSVYIIESYITYLINISVDDKLINEIKVLSKYYKELYEEFCQTMLKYSEQKQRNEELEIILNQIKLDINKIVSEFNLNNE